MFADIDLQKLTELTSPDRCFLSLYLENPRSLDQIENRIKKMSKSLSTDNAEKDERKHLSENWNMVKKYLKKNPNTNGSLCIFACWLLDFFKAIPLAVKVSDLVWLDSSPYVRPLAELQDEYENVAVVFADNKAARIFMVSSAIAGDEDVVRGNVKNHVRKGGWSQQRYERRRDKQLLHYARDIVDKLKAIDHEEKISHILLVGGKEILHKVYDNLPQFFQKKTAIKKSDFSKGSASVNEDMWDLFSDLERKSESDLWEKIRSEYLKSGLGAVGIESVLSAVKDGKIEKMIVCRDFKPSGYRCRDCDAFFIESRKNCGSCQSSSLYEVDAVNELVELVVQQNGETDFVDPINTLVESGSIGALLRYR